MSRYVPGVQSRHALTPADSENVPVVQLAHSVAAAEAEVVEGVWAICLPTIVRVGTGTESTGAVITVITAPVDSVPPPTSFVF